MSKYLAQATLAEDRILTARIAACAAGLNVASPSQWANTLNWTFAIQAGWAEAVLEAQGDAPEATGKMILEAVTDAMILEAVTGVVAEPQEEPEEEPDTQEEQTVPEVPEPDEVIKEEKEPEVADESATQEAPEVEEGPGPQEESEVEEA